MRAISCFFHTFVSAVVLGMFQVASMKQVIAVANLLYAGVAFARVYHAGWEGRPKTMWVTEAVMDYASHVGTFALLFYLSENPI